MRVEVYGLPDCPRCDAAVSRLRRAGLPVEELSLQDVRRAVNRQVDVLTQCVMQDSRAPVIRAIHVKNNERKIEFIEPDHLEQWLMVYMSSSNPSSPFRKLP